MPEIILLSSPLSPAKAHHLGQVVKSLVWTFFFPFFCKDKIFVCTSTYVAIEMGSKCGRGVALCILIHIENFLTISYSQKQTNLMAFYNKYWVKQNHYIQDRYLPRQYLTKVSSILGVATLWGDFRQIRDNMLGISNFRLFVKRMTKSEHFWF